MKRVKWGRLLRRGRAMYLAYDQGLEHGPESDFDDKTVDPLYILKIAKAGKFNAVVYHKGIVEKYGKEIKKSKVPLIYKLNGKTKLVSGEPVSAQIATVAEAKKAGASAVGFTIYIGSKHEAKMIEQFEKIQRESHKKGLPVIVWMYPRGGKVKNDVSREMIAYAARVGLEIGADMVKMKYGGKSKDLAWAVKSAGRTKVVIAGGTKKGEKAFYKDVREIMKSGASGIAVGRNVWQSKEPLKVAHSLRRIIWG
jgi:fructose-bisphosphate aldolase, class I